VPYCTHFIAVSGNSVAEWEMDKNSKCKNLIQILRQSKGNLPLVPYCTDLFEKILSLTLPIEFKAGTGTNSFHRQCKLIIQ